MPRESYYQKVGNPIQNRLLPSRAMSLALPAPEADSAAREWQILKVIVAVLVIDIIDSIAATAAPRIEFNTLRSIGIVFISLALTGHFTTVFSNPIARFSYGAVGVLSSFATGMAIFAFDFDRIGWLHAGLIATGYLWVFAKHWTERCLTAPLGRSTAKSIRQQWAGVIVLLASAPLIVAVCVSFCSALVASFVCLTAVIVPSFVLPRPRRSQWPTRVGPWTSWLTYNIENHKLPGVFVSPAGNAVTRACVTVASCFVIGACIRDILPITFVAPSLIALFLPLTIMRPALVNLGPHWRDSVTPDRWPSLVTDLRTSPNPIERRSCFMGRVRADGSPLVVPRDVFFEHGHFLGDSGAGKTALGLAPFIEQTIGFGDCSLVTIDLKADTLELLATMIQGARILREQRGIEMPLKYLTTRDDLSTFAFNPQSQPFWQGFNSYKRTDLLTGATGLEYGADFGAAFYSAANAGVLNHTYRVYPNVETFVDLAERCGHVLVSANKRDVHPEIRRNGVHVHEVLKRLASFAPLNVTSNGGYPQDVIDHAIDLADVFRRPQMLYCHLSSTLGPGSAPAFARFVVFFLLACASTAERKVPVFIVIDEFQRMVARNFEYLLQLARSMNVGIILANQSLQDLETATANLIPTIEANCRYRQWFSVSSLDDRRRLSESSGETVEYFTTRGESQNDKGTSTSVSVTEHVMPRLSTNDIALASDHPKHSIVRISRGLGYAQYGGLPFVVESDFHIARDEYERRKRMPWPHREPGTFIPDEWVDPDGRVDSGPENPSAGPIVTTEVIGEEPEDPFGDFLNGIESEEEQPKSKRRRRRK